jgi:hypothetical protein
MSFYCCRASFPQAGRAWQHRAGGAATLKGCSGRQAVELSGRHRRVLEISYIYGAILPRAGGAWRHRAQGAASSQSLLRHRAVELDDRHGGFVYKHVSEFAQVCLQSWEFLEMSFFFYRASLSRSGFAGRHQARAAVARQGRFGHRTFSLSGRCGRVV